MNITDELKKASGFNKQQSDFPDIESYKQALARACDKISDAAFIELSDKAYTWVNAAINSMRKKQPITAELDMERSVTYDDTIFPVYYVPMPLNKKGHGPEMDPTKVVRTQHEIWDQNNLAIATVCDEQTARLIVARLNS